MLKSAYQDSLVCVKLITLNAIFELRKFEFGVGLKI